MDYQDLLEYYSQLDRSKFLDGDLMEYAAIDTPLPIGYGQTISQPSLVLEMTRCFLRKETAGYWRLVQVPVIKLLF